jgi:hypothetical protein
MPRFVLPTLKAFDCFQFQITLKTGIVSSESGESSGRKFGLRAGGIMLLCAMGSARAALEVIYVFIASLKKLKNILDLSL